jgi:hypothetical protein
MQEYLDAGLYIKNFRLSNNRFTITYYPLSDDELADIRINKKEINLRQLSMMDMIEHNGLQQPPTTW